MKKLRTLICLLALLLMIPSMPLSVRAEDRKRIYTSTSGRQPGDYYMTLDDYYELIYQRRFNQKRYESPSVTTEEAAAYASEMAPLDIADLKAADWFIDVDTGELIFEYSGGRDIYTVFSITDMGCIHEVYEMLHMYSIDSLPWQEVMVPDADHAPAHGQYYLNTEMIWDAYYQQAKAFYASYPGDMTEEEIEKDCREYADMEVNNYTKCSYTILPDEKLYQVRRTYADNESVTTLYYPLACYDFYSFIDFPVNEYVMEYHDYSECEWNWTDEDTVTATLICSLGSDTLTLTINDIVKEVITEPGDYTEGELKCTATVSYYGKTFTDTHNFPIPALIASGEFIVEFETNGGEPVASQTIKAGEKVQRPEDPWKEDCELVGWYSDADLTKPYDFDTPVISDMVLYADWRAVEISYEVQGETTVEWTKGSDEPLVITVKRNVNDDLTFSKHFTGVKLDENELSLGEDYDAVSGSVVVTVKPAALEELEEGEHTVTVSFDDGSAAVTVTVKAQPIVPATGENSRLTYPASMMALSLLAMGLLVLKRKVQGQLN